MYAYSDKLTVVYLWPTLGYFLNRIFKTILYDNDCQVIVIS